MRLKDFPEEFKRILGSERIARLFELNEGKEIPILCGYKITEHESDFEKRRNYGQYEKGDGGFFPTGSLGWLIASGEYQNRKGWYKVKFDSETYELTLTSEGLKHIITHEHRSGSRYATGPDKKYQKMLHQDILHPDFPNYGGGLLLNQDLKILPHNLETTLDAIVFQSGLSEKAIIKRLKNIEENGLKKKEFQPKKIKSFRTLDILGIEPGMSKHNRHFYGSGNWK